MALTGAEGVVESGGVINKTGSFTLALAAAALSVPFYVAAESYKVKQAIAIFQLCMTHALHEVPNLYPLIAAFPAWLQICISDLLDRSLTHTFHHLRWDKHRSMNSVVL